MSKRMCLFAALALLVSVPSAYAVGVFEVTEDVSEVPGAGSTEFLGYNEYLGKIVPQYLMTGYGADIWGNTDQFHFAYRTMQGSVRISAAFDWLGNVPDGWSKYAVMIRANDTPGSINYFCGSREDNSLAQHQWRPVANSGSSSQSYQRSAAADSPAKPYKVGLQRVMVGGWIPVVEAMVDWGKGAGWERVGTLKIMPPLPNEVLVGLAVTSHTWQAIVQCVASDVQYETDVALVGPSPFGVVPAEAAVAAPTTEAGFKIRSVKAIYTTDWGRAEMNKLLDFGCTGPMCVSPGMPVPGMEAGEAISQFVNLHDTGGRGSFFADNGYPDETYPGIDPFESPTADPAAGDDDNTFATEVTAVVHLTAGVHMFGARHDDGVYVTVGGVLVGSNDSWDGGNAGNFIFEVAQEGYYPLNVRSFEGSGGAALELHEVFQAEDGSIKRILLGDVANGGSPVFLP